MSGTLFDGYTATDLAEHAAKHPTGSVEPLLLDFSYQNAFIVNVAGMPVGQIEWTMVQDESAFSEDDDIAAKAKGDYNGYHLVVTSLVVAEAFRNRGLGRLLFERFAAFADHHHGFLNGPGSGWDPGTFTADGAAFYKAVTGQDVKVTSRISIG